MTPLEELSDLLFEARKKGMEPDPRAFEIKVDRDQALAVQLAMLARFEAEGRRVGGWKVGLTSGAVRDSMGPGFRPFGFILADRILETGASIDLSAIHQCQIEPELCLILGRDLQGLEVDAQQARDAVSGVAPSFEINEKRVLIQQGRELLVADGLANWGIVVGEPVPAISDLSAISVTFSSDGDVLSDGKPEGGIDDPYSSLATLARLLSAHGRGLQAGDRVITGAFDKRMVTDASQFEARFSGIGSIEVSFH